jgi:hypothetical protein
VAQNRNIFEHGIESLSSIKGLLYGVHVSGFLFAPDERDKQSGKPCVSTTKTMDNAQYRSMCKFYNTPLSLTFILI